MSKSDLPNPFECARRLVGVSVMLKPEDIMSVWSISRQRADELLDRHGAAIAVQMLAAGQQAVIQMIKKEGTTS